MEVSQIACYQKKAFHCLVRVTKLLRMPTVARIKLRQAELLWFYFFQFRDIFSRLVLTILSKPMLGVALESNLYAYNSRKVLESY
jgi:hypothetical protein